MRDDQRKRLLLSAQNWLYVALVLVIAGLMAWLSTRYVFEADWTANNRNSLTEPSVELLDTMEGPLDITAFASEDAALRASIREFVGRYQREKPDVSLEFVNPDTAPQRVRELGITRDGALLVAYAGGTETVTGLSEQPLTNALARLARKEEHKVLFLTGHGERAPTGQANFDLGSFGSELQSKGFTLETLNLAQDPGIPEDARLLVIASPRVSYLPGEVRMIREYAKSGGNLLWLIEPDGLHGLDALAEELGVSRLPGTVVDPTSRLFGISDPAYSLVVEYPDHPLTRGLSSITLFPESAALTAPVGRDWEATPVLRTVERSWTESGEIAGEIRFDEDTEERPGPLTIGLALTREVKSTGETGDDGNEGTAQANDDDTDEGNRPAPVNQRVLVTGDGDFLSNSFLGNGANLELGVRIFNWLAGDDEFIEIAPRTAPDTGLQLDRFASGAIAVGFLFVLPALLVLAGAVIWWRRRRR